MKVEQVVDTQGSDIAAAPMQDLTPEQLAAIGAAGGTPEWGFEIPH